MTSNPRRRKFEHRPTYWEHGCGKTEAEAGEMLPQAKGHLEPIRARRAKERSSPIGSEKQGPAKALTLDFWPPESEGPLLFEVTQTVVLTTEAPGHEEIVSLLISEHILRVPLSRFPHIPANTGCHLSISSTS